MRTHVRLAMAVVVAIGGRAFAATPDATAELRTLQAEMQAQQSVLNSQSKELSGLRVDQGQTWLTATRAEQVKTLVREVLSDADTRASLMDSAITAGHNGKNFFLASEDGNFLLTIDGQVQVRYIWNHIRDNDTRNDNEGFQMRRAKIGFYGHVYDPKLTYGLRVIAGDNENGRGTFGTSGTIVLSDAWAAYDLGDGWNVKGGQFKAPFLREEAVNSRYQLAVERSLTADLFTVNFTQGVQVGWTGELAGLPVRAAAMIHDGSYAANTDYTSTAETEVSVAGRVEVIALGSSWEQFDDFTTWSTDQTALLLGAAVDYENAEGDSGTSTDVDRLKWTVDASVEVPSAFGFNAFAAVIGNHLIRREKSTGAGAQENVDQYGVVVQAGVFVIPDKWELFARYEYIDFSSTDTDGEFRTGGLGSGFGSDSVLNLGDSSPQLLTFGTNYYMHKHGSKFTLDVVWVLQNTDGIFDATDGGPATTQGIIYSGKDDQVSIRAQYQLLF